MPAAVKALLYLGAALLVGAGVFARFIGPDLQKTVQTGVLTGAGSPYGRTLIVKVALISLIVAIAAVHRLWLLPAVRGATGSAGNCPARRLGLLLRAEALLLIAVLITTGALTNSTLPHP